MAEQEAKELEAIPALATYWALQHQQEQESIAQRVALGLGLLWPTIRVNELVETTTTWLHAITLQIQQGWNESATAAFEYVQNAKFSWEPDSKPLTQASVEFPVADIQIAMRVRGPIEVRRQLERAIPESDAMKAGQKASTGTGATKATDGGRAQVLQLIRKDAPARLKQGRTIGYARKTDSNPCYFCALLASQGAVYFSEKAFDGSNSKIREVKWTSNNDKGTRRAFIGDGPAKVHDNCQCTLRPVYDKRDSKDERAKFFLDQWINADDEKDFRRKYVPPPPYSADVLDLSERRDIVARVQNNRDALMANGFRADSPNVKFLDKSIRALAAV